MFVEEVMRRKVITVRPDQTVLEALQLAKVNRIRHLPVTRDNNNKLVGIVSDRDLRDVSPSVLLEQHSAVLQSTKVEEIMKREVITVHPLDCLDDAARLMYKHRIGCLPVVRRDRLVGIITDTDLLRTLIELIGSTDTGSTLEIKVPERYGSLAEITEIIKKHKISIASCFIRPDKSPQHRLIVMRLKTIDPTQIIAKIQKAGYQVLRPFAGEDEHHE